MAIWTRFCDGIPTYLAQYYWWAYLWRPAMWFFDHQPIINAILCGQYQRLLNQTLGCLQTRPTGHILQLACVYGNLTPVLLHSIKQEALYLIDVVTAQLELSRRKAPTNPGTPLLSARMNAEYLGLMDNAFTTVLIFFLCHELPPEARHRTYKETLRVLAPGGHLVITDYAPLPARHWLYRFWPWRLLMTRLKPFLNSFWREDLQQMLQQQAQCFDKRLQLVEEHRFFSDFYRVSVFEVSGA
ncbi:MAG: hypothetical protein BMS9Abin36_1705 [Gammaproteobacteria bacterium]|nr:MAG: hypothetical protein BMS9Abin36_1705 [Gammaproteobacteria bacterium]